ncbi:MAG TPA: hypothetical protein PKC28_08745 [Bdellovibrionales bacterium]|jgi:hypothetical protein|nr:hypothetical protein [Bdellovibrionales bacterium]
MNVLIIPLLLFSLGIPHDVQAANGKPAKRAKKLCRDGGAPPCDDDEAGGREVDPREEAAFRAYMQMNASHPALSNRILNQQRAFEEVKKPAVIDIPKMNDGLTSDSTGGAAKPPEGEGGTGSTP